MIGLGRDEDEYAIACGLDVNIVLDINCTEILHLTYEWTKDDALKLTCC